MARARYAACFSCQGKAQSVIGVTESQRAGLSRGRVKGDNHRRGYKHREESKQKTSASNRTFWAANPEKAITRAKRGNLAYNWKGGVARLNTSIRLMHEYRVWARSVRERDGCCVQCGATSDLEAHHNKPFAPLLETLGIRSRDDARRHASIIFDLNIGETLCVSCHDAEHGRKPRGNRRADVRENAAASAGFVCEGP